MLTLKQVEAVYWVSTLGSFNAAADRLNATQSTISKRILDLEAFLGVDVFERSNRAQLTLKGRELMGDFEKMLELQQSVVSRAGNESSYSGRFRLGVTEMVALTWLPALISEVRKVYPLIVLEPKVDHTTKLWPQMTSHLLDMVICPHLQTEGHLFETVQLGFMDSSWMCRPDLRTIQTSLVLPPLEYNAVHRSDAVSLRIAEIARGVCDFGRPRWHRRQPDTAAIS